MAALERAGEFRFHPQKTRIAFISRMTFGGVALARDWADLGLILPEPLDTPRNRKLELYGPSSWGHSIRLHQPAEVDEQVHTWLADALRRGDQETLDSSREVTPLTGRQLDLFRTGFRTRVENDRVELPAHVADALALVDDVVAQVGGHKSETMLRRSGGVAYIQLDPMTGLGENDQTDVFLRVSV